MDNQRRKEIIEEEKLRRQIQNSERDKGAIGCLVVFLIIVVVFVIYAFSDNGSNNLSTDLNSSSNTQDVVVQENKEGIINDIAPVYCENHQSIYLVEVDNLIQEGFPMHDGVSGFTDKECRTIIEKLYSIDPNREHLLNVAENKYWIGMDYRLLTYSIGMPSDINSTTTVFGKQSQLVYGDPLKDATYIYLEDGIVSSYQN